MGKWKSANISEIASCRVKWSEFWDLEVDCNMYLGTFDLLVVKVILRVIRSTCLN